MFLKMVIKTAFIPKRIASWQAHLQRISCYLQEGEGVWWRHTDDSYEFFDGSDLVNHPTLCHFRDNILNGIQEKIRCACKKY